MPDIHGNRTKASYSDPARHGEHDPYANQVLSAKAALRCQHIQAHGPRCECRAFEVEAVIAAEEAR